MGISICIDHVSGSCLQVATHRSLDGVLKPQSHVISFILPSWIWVELVILELTATLYAVQPLRAKLKMTKYKTKKNS